MGKGRKKTGLTDFQKSQVKELLKQGKTIDQISQAIHTHFYKVREYMKAVGLKEDKKTSIPLKSLPKTIPTSDFYNLSPNKLDSVIQMMLDGEDFEEIFYLTGVGKYKAIRIICDYMEAHPEYKTQLNIKRWANIPKSDPIFFPVDSPIEYDLTMNSHDEDAQIVKGIRDNLGEDAEGLTFEIHKEIELGGKYVPGSAPNAQLEVLDAQPVVKVKVDIYIPEFKMIVISLKSNDDRLLLAKKTGNQANPVNGLNNMFNFYIYAWNKYHLAIGDGFNVVYNAIGIIREELFYKRIHERKK